MNRRQFFGMTAAAVAAAGLSPLVLPHKTIFLPPRYGWKPSELGVDYMREIQQYNLNNCSFIYRYDASGRDWNGNEYQYHVDMFGSDPKVAATMIQEEFDRREIIPIDPTKSGYFKLKLLPGNGRFV